MQNQKARRPSKKKKPVTAKTKAIQQNARQRERLAPHVGKILDIVADYICTGKKTITVTSGIMENTILLKNIRTPHGQSICDHIWVRFSDVKNLASHIRQLSSGITDINGASSAVDLTGSEMQCLYQLIPTDNHIFFYGKDYLLK